MTSPSSSLLVAIACGGTGGHLFPGLAVGRELVARGCRATLLVSPKEVDQAAVAGLTGLGVATLPATGLQDGRRLAFALGFWRAFHTCSRLFRTRGGRPDALLAMGGFTAAPPFLAARLHGAATFLHESNTVPGRANRLLSRFVDRAFIGFPEATTRLRSSACECVGTPVRDAIAQLRKHRDAASARVTLGLDPHRPVLLITGGSQGARGLNRLVSAALPALALAVPDLQFIHLSGTPDLEAVRTAHRPFGQRSVVRPFLAEMHLALAAADAVVSRAGASSMAELAALRLPSVLVPLPTAADNHQAHNADSFVRAGAAIRLDQDSATATELVEAVVSILPGGSHRGGLKMGLERMDRPGAAAGIAEAMLSHLREPFTQAARRNAPSPRKPTQTARRDDAAVLIPAKETP